MPCSTSAWSPGSATSGGPRASGAPGLSPWLPLAGASDEELRDLLADTASLMRGSVAGARPPRLVYRRAGRPCPRCGEPVRSRGQGDENRTAYWCPRCQRGPSPG